jgi:hypothetical protein
LLASDGDGVWFVCFHSYSADWSGLFSSVCLYWVFGFGVLYYTVDLAETTSYACLFFD